VRVGRGSGAGWQWFGTLSVAPNGRLDVVWNDAADPGDPATSQLHYALSLDGGTSWILDLVVSPAWNSHLGWPVQRKIGDYYHLVSDVLGANLAWAATLNGEQDVWFLRLGPPDCNGNGVPDGADVAAGTSTDWNWNGVPDDCEELLLADAAAGGTRLGLPQNVPNPFRGTTWFTVEVPADGPAQLEILDVAGRRLRALPVPAPGRRAVVGWDGRDAGGRRVASGVYFYRLAGTTAGAPRRLTLLD
jgi:hypothetical protein